MLNQNNDSNLKIYVLTTGNEERVKRINEFLSDLNFEFIQSDSYQDLLILEKKYKRSSHKFRQKAIMAGEIGCFKSHTKAWEKIIESNTPSIIIEDNIEFIDNPKRLVSAEFDDLIRSCGLIGFTNLSYKLYPHKPFIISSIPEKKPFPTVCYGLTPERAFNLLQSMKKNPYIMPIDKWLSIPKLSGCYGFISHIRIAKRANGLSSIANRKKGEKSINPINIFYWAKNKIKYNY